MDKTKNTAVNERPKTAGELRELLANADSNSAKSGNLSARERITAIFDEGTFTEIAAYARRRISEFDSTAPDEFESVICGYGSVDGCLVYAFAEDIGRAKGSISEEAARKICQIYKLAIDNGCPVVGIFDSAGAYITEGVRALAGYGAIMKAVSQASGVIPQIAVCAGVVQGAAAVIAAMFDFVTTTEDSKVSVNPPFIVGGGTAKDSLENGIASISVKKDADAAAAVRELLGYLPSNNEEGGVETVCGDEVNRTIDYSYSSIDELIRAFADDGKYLKLGTEYAASITTGFITLGGFVCGIIGTDSSVDSGRLTSAGARKAARMISFCDSFRIPVITLVDTEGFTVSGDEEKNPFCSEIAKLAGTYASAKTPLITLVCGKAYGSAFSILGSKSIGADIVYALDTAKIGCMSPESAVALLWNNKISKNVTRESLEAKWTEEVDTVVAAASTGEIDDIIDGSEIRQRLASAVMMLSGKAASAPRRRHANMPL